MRNLVLSVVFEMYINEPEYMFRIFNQYRGVSSSFRNFLSERKFVR